MSETSSNSSLEPDVSQDPTGEQKHERIFDPDGDLVLRVQEHHTFKVCSAALRRASPVFKTMLFGPWKESKASLRAGEDWIVELPEDSADAFHIILTVVHGQPQKLSDVGVVPFIEFAEVVLLADKYDFRQVMRSWICDWHQDDDNRRLFEELQPDKDDFLAALKFSWDWGFQDVLLLLLRNVITHADEKELRELRAATGFFPRIAHLLGKRIFLLSYLLTGQALYSLVA